MQFVVEIPDKCVTEDTCFTEWVQNAGKDFRFNILPKGHGRLIDAEALDMKRIDYIVDGYANDADDCAEFGMMIILAPTIIEADGGEE